MSEITVLIKEVQQLRLEVELLKHLLGWEVSKVPPKVALANGNSWFLTPEQEDALTND